MRYGVVVNSSRWRPPDDGVFKINMDTVTYFKNKMIGFSAINRENSGGVKVTSIKNAKAILVPIIVEAMAIKHGILLALESGLVPFQIEADSVYHIILCVGRIPSADVGYVICEILDLLELLPC
ncbi:hypothetical protein Ddye_026103 [Dipteronia dyeriana]|uniref:RNase H type-1 domain-containing protein n=1 Tax=Dipteronia dyeriana TaxID=168575 RepID=A0AAD9TM17_9ROSI|nr:hypothetical protein Ddye_026103 [Dipteronia dyeriana]